MIFPCAHDFQKIWQLKGPPVIREPQVSARKSLVVCLLPRELHEENKHQVWTLSVKWPEAFSCTSLYPSKWLHSSEVGPTAVHGRNRNSKLLRMTLGPSCCSGEVSLRSSKRRSFKKWSELRSTSNNSVVRSLSSHSQFSEKHFL